MVILWAVLGVLAALAGLLGCILTVLPGPPLSWIGLLLIVGAFGNVVVDTAIRLKAAPTPAGPAPLWEAGNLLLQKFPAETLTVTTALELRASRPGVRAGLVVMGRDYAALALSRTERGFEMSLAAARRADTGGAEQVEARADVPASRVLLRATVGAGAVVSFEYSTNGSRFTSMGGPFAARAGAWVGAKIGVFALSPDGGPAGDADVDWFRVEGPPSGDTPVRWSQVLKERPGWYASEDAIRIADAVLLYHDPVPPATLGQLVVAWWGESLAAPKVFCWRQPFRSRRWPDRLPADARGRRGVVLVHGFVCNRGLWNRWMARLHSVDAPFAAVDLEPVFGSIDDYAPIIESAVARVEQATGLAPVVVAHSMGGLAVRHWLAGLGEEADARVHHVVTIGTPHAGTWLARWGLSPNTRHMRRSSAWLRRIRELEPGTRAALFTCFYSHCDNIVFPASTAMLPGAENRHLPGVAHVQMADRPEPWEAALRHLMPR